MSSVPIDRGWAWVVSLAVMFNNIVIVGLINVTGIIFIEMVQNFNESARFVSFVIGIRAAVFSISAIGSLWILNEFVHTRILVISAGLLAALGFASSFFAQSVHHMFAYSILVGAGLSPIYGSGLVMVGKYFEKRRSLATGIATCGSSVGTLIVPHLMFHLIEKYHFQGAMLICGGMCLNICVAGLLLRPTDFYERFCVSDDKPVINDTTESFEMSNVAEYPKIIIENDNAHFGTKYNGNRNFTDDSKHTKVFANKRSPRDTLFSQCDYQYRKIPYNFFIISAKERSKKKLLNLSLLKNPRFIIFQVASSICLTMLSIQPIFLPAIAEEDKRSLSEITILLSAFGIADFLGRLFIGYLGDYCILRRRAICLICSISIGILAIMIRFLTGFWLLLLYHCIYGFLSTAYPVLVPVIFVDIFGVENLSRSVSSVLFLKGIIQTGFAPALGTIKDRTGTFNWSFTLIGCTTIFAGLMLFSATLQTPLNCKQPYGVPSEKDKIHEANDSSL